MRRRDFLKTTAALSGAPLVGAGWLEQKPGGSARQPARQGNAARANYPQASGQLSAMGMTLGLAYHVTGEERYAQKLRQALLHYAGYQQWCSPGYNTRTPSWNSELATGAFCVGAAAGYDALYDSLPVSERKQIAEAIARVVCTFLWRRTGARHRTSGVGQARKRQTFRRTCSRRWRP